MGKISSYLCGVWSDIASVPRLTCESAREMRDVRSLAGSSMLTALSVVLNQFTIFFTQVLRLVVMFLPFAMWSMLYLSLIHSFTACAWREPAYRHDLRDAVCDCVGLRRQKRRYKSDAA